jgi:hypothetical protein
MPVHLSVADTPGAVAAADLSHKATKRLRLIMQAQHVSVTELAQTARMDPEDVARLYDNDRDMTIGEALTLLRAMDVHPMALIEGVASASGLIPPALMDPATGNLAVRLASATPHTRDYILRELTAAEARDVAS